MPHMNIRDLGRLREIGVVLARHGFGQLVQVAGIDIGKRKEDVAAGTKAPDLPVARRIRMVLVDLGPTFVKLGQVLSVRPDIAPADLIEELAILQDRVPASPADEIRALVEEELGRPIGDVFASFDPEPLASASIAQVHRAVLHGEDGTPGEEVAVKVQRPGIRGRIRSDLHILYSLAHLLQGRIPLPGIYTPVGIVQEFEAAITQELDFLQEARAATRFRACFAEHPDITAPQVHGRWTTGRILVLELFEGQRIRDLKGQEEVAAAAMRKVMEATYQQVFEHGFFHGDPHPGNLMLLKDGRIGFIDFGLTGTLTGEMQDVIIHLFTGLISQDAESVALTLYRAGATEGRVDLKSFRSEIQRLLTKYHGATLEELTESASLSEFVQVAARHRIRLVPEYAVLARAVSLLDGLVRELMPRCDIVEEVRPYALRLAGQRLAPERLGGDALRLFQHAHIAAQDLPLQLSQLLLDAERGNMVIQARDPEAAELREAIQRSANRTALALLSAGMLIAGAILFSGGAPVLVFGPSLMLAGALVGGMGALLFVGLAFHVLFAARLHPRGVRRQAVGVFRFFFSGRQ